MMSRVGRLRAAARRRRSRAAYFARLRFFRIARRFTPYLAVESRGQVFLVDTRDSGLGAKLYAKRMRKEQRVLRLALDLLEDAGAPASRDTLLDVGANVGTTSLDALTLGFARVHAFEPAPDNLPLLAANIALNGAAGRVLVHPLALSDRVGTASLDVGMTSSAKPWIVASPSAHRSSGLVAEVSLRTIDDLVAEGTVDPARVGLVWIDVEGHEAHVLAGAGHLLEHGPPLVIELAPGLLARAGRLEELPAMLAAYYTHVADLRTRSRASLRPVAEVGALIESYGKRGLTDLLACRLPPVG